jgi:hypothetical protein
MDKKDIYEHLAKIYLDASLKKKKNSVIHPHLKKYIFLSVFIILGLAAFLFVRSGMRNRSLNSEIALVVSTDTVKINFHFDPARKETYSINLNNLDLSNYRNLAFTVKSVDYQNGTSLRVEFINNFKEKSEIYIKEIPRSWRDYKFVLADFKNITDWSQVSSLIFTVEEWNATGKKGIVYLDNIRFLR